MSVGWVRPPGEDLEAVVQLRNVHKAFAAPGGRRAVLTGLDLAVAPGEIVVVAGRSGSGKTTLLTLVAGWEQPDQGSVMVLDASVPADQRPWGDVAIVPQSLGLLEELTVAENVGLPLRLAPGTAGAAAEPADLLDQLGLAHLAGRLPGEISLGEQQRVALARAAVVRPRLLLADEPISHQNEAWARTCMTVLGALAAGGTGCLLATHNEVAFEVAQRVLELRAGLLSPRPA